MTPEHQGHAKASVFAGIRSTEDLRLRCYVDEADCWHWRGGTSRGLPAMYLPALARSVGIATAIAWLMTGKPAARNRPWRIACGTQHCCNPAHRKAGYPQPGRVKSAEEVAKIKRALRVTDRHIGATS